MSRNIWFAVLVSLNIGPVLPAAKSMLPDFTEDVRPILEKNCFHCHSNSSPQAHLDLETSESMLAGGKSGPAFVPGASAQSLMVSKVTSGSMPPGESALSRKEIQTIREWIDAQTNNISQASVTEKDVLPIFQMYCVTCHGKSKQEAELDLRTRASRLKGGKSGPALKPGDPEQSLLYTRLISREMPPLNEIRPPTTAEVDTIRQWIKFGAPEDQATADQKQKSHLKPEDQDFWSFRPPQRSQVPRVRQQDRVRNPIDSFLLARLETKGLGFSPEAKPLVLLRRAYLDLIGMPPSSEEVLSYLNDHSPEAYEHLIDRLLDSSHYGERWAQYWLDLAGYSDSEGIVDEDKVRPHAWRYRDYVIRALNGDTPYNLFLTEQLAGDELVDFRRDQKVTQELVDTLAATGFLRLTTDGTYAQPNRSLQDKMNVIADELEVFGSSILGLTIGCARCHDHKYDPITQNEYYSLSAIFQTALDPYDWLPPTNNHRFGPTDERVLSVALESELTEVKAHNNPLKAQLQKLKSELEEKAAPLKEKWLKESLASLPKDIQADIKVIITTPKEKRTELQSYLVRKFKDVIDPSYTSLSKRFPEFKTYADKAQKDIEHIENAKYGSETNFRDKTKLRLKPGIRALYDMGGEPSPVYRLNRGEAQSVGERVYPAVPRILSADGLEPFRPVKLPGQDTSGMRLGLARWLTQPNHPLTSRVQINRLWSHHFGNGLVTTPGNFGRTGSKPSHPKLLDWLATEFVNRGWSLKAMHRLIMTSSAYRQSSHVSQSTREKDPDNLLLSRMPMRRMDSEALHDSVLQVTGQLDPTAFGLPTFLTEEASGEVIPESTKKGWRRAIYLLKRRRMPVSFLEAFDYPVMTPNCGQRRNSTVALQALQLMNGELMRKHARYLAGRLMDGAPGNIQKQVNDLYLQVLSRQPTKNESQNVLASLNSLQIEWHEHLEKNNNPGPRKPTSQWSALSSVTLTLLNSAEFIYID